MGKAKDIRIEPIAAQDARRIIKSIHYSGKVVNNSKIHFGVFLNGKCGGALSFGSSMDKRKTIGLVAGTKWNEFIELNRMAFADWLPRNSESRAIAYTMRYFRKHYPFMRWVLSYADGTKCGDGTIYRASGFTLTNIGRNTTMIELPWGERVASLCLSDTRRPMRLKIAERLGIRVGGESSIKPFLDAGCKMAPGFQLRYIYFLDPTYKSKLTVPALPYSAIAEAGASMYKGEST